MMRPSDFPWRRWIGVVVGMLSVVLLFALLVMAIDNAKEKAAQAESRNKLKQLGFALHNYHDVNRSLPSGGTFNEAGQGLYGWPISILPYVECNTIYGDMDREQPWDSPRNRKILSIVHRAYTMPDARPQTNSQGVGLTHYSANPAVFYRNSHVTFKELLGQPPQPLGQEKFTEAMAQVWFLGELAGDYPPWPCPENWRPLDGPLNAGPRSYGRPTGDGAQFLMGDGSVRFVSNAAWKDL